MISAQEVEKFRAMYKKRFDVEITPEQAYELGTKLIRLFELVIMPSIESEFQKIQQRQNQKAGSN
jgi:hypothetical protein